MIAGFWFGPNVDARLPLDDGQILGSGASWFRGPLRLDASAPATVARLVAQGLKFLAAVDSTTAGGSLSEYRRAYDGLITAIQIGNEWEHSSVSSSPNHPLTLKADGWATLAPISVLGGMADGRPEVLTPEIADAFDFPAFHPYGRRPLPDWPSLSWGFGYLGDLASGYAAKAQGKPSIISEFGVRTDELSPADRARFYAESVRTAIRHPGVTGIFPFGLNNGAGGGADQYRLTQACLDAMRDVILEELAREPAIPDDNIPNHIPGGAMINRPPFWGTIEQWLATQPGTTLWKPPGIPLLRSRGSGTSRERTGLIDKVDGESISEFVQVREEGGYVYVDQIYPPNA